MVDFSTHSQCFFEGIRTNGHDHEFLYVYCVVCVFTTVHDVHHGNGHCFCIEAAQILIQRHIQCFCSCFCYCHGNTQDRICAQFAFVVCAVQFDHCFINSNLIQRIHTDDCISDDIVYIVYCVLYANAVVSVAAVTQFYCFESTCGCAAGNSCTTHDAVIQDYFYFNCGITSGVQNFSCVYVCNFVITFHFSILLMFALLYHLLISKLSPVISTGFSMPIISSKVGAISASLPPSFRPIPSV